MKFIGRETDRRHGAVGKKAGAACLVAGLVTTAAQAQSVIDTSFSTADGFTTGGTTPVDLTTGDLTLTVSGGQQQQSFDGPSYNAGPNAYLFISGPSFTGTTGNTATGTGDTGDLTFSSGVTEVSFFAADRAFGTPTVRVFGVDNATVLAEVPVTDTDIRPGANPTPLSFNAQDLGGLIGRVQIDNAGPNANPPYVTAIDSLSVTRANRYDDSVNGNASSNGAAPTALDFELGSNTVAGTVSANSAVDNTRNFYTFTIEEGQELAAISLLDSSVDLSLGGSDNNDPGFFALVAGVTAATPGSGFSNLGGALFNPSDPFGTNLLGEISGGGISGGTGFSTIGPGDYTFVIQQTGNEVSSFLLDFEVVPEPSTAALTAVAFAVLLRRRKQA